MKTVIKYHASAKTKVKVTAKRHVKSQRTLIKEVLNRIAALEHMVSQLLAAPSHTDIVAIGNEYATTTDPARKKELSDLLVTHWYGRDANA